MMITLLLLVITLRKMKPLTQFWHCPIISTKNKVLSFNKREMPCCPQVPPASLSRARLTRLYSAAVCRYTWLGYFGQLFKNKPHIFDTLQLDTSTTAEWKPMLWSLLPISSFASCAKRNHSVRIGFCIFVVKIVILYDKSNAVSIKL